MTPVEEAHLLSDCCRHLAAALDRGDPAAVRFMERETVERTQYGAVSMLCLLRERRRRLVRKGLPDLPFDWHAYLDRVWGPPDPNAREVTPEEIHASIAELRKKIEARQRKQPENPEPDPRRKR